MRALVMMQLKEKIDMSFLKTTKSTITKVVFTILGFVAVILLCFAFFYVAQLLRLFSLAGYIPVTVLAIAFSVMLASPITKVAPLAVPIRVAFSAITRPPKREE